MSPCCSGSDVGGMDDALDAARSFSTKERQRLAKSGQALPDGSYPIVTKQDLQNAIQAYGRASNKAAAKRHIIKRAKALGQTAMLPEDWASQVATSPTKDSASMGDGMDMAQKEKKQGYRKKKKDNGSLEFACIHDACGERTFSTEKAAHDHALAVHSHSEVRIALSKTLREKFAGPPRQWAYVEDTADDWFIYSLEMSGAVDEKLYRQEYVFSDGVATLQGEPVEVRRRMVYEPIGQD